jgi:hypothetical protein
MPRPVPPACAPCKGLALTLIDRGLSHWLRQEDGDQHYMTTKAAVRWRQSAPDDRIEALRERLREIGQAGHVAWIDVLRDGDIVVFHAPHGAIPVEIPRPT